MERCRGQRRISGVRSFTSIRRGILHGGQGRYDDELREMMTSEDQKLMLEPPYVSNRKPVV